MKVALASAAIMATAAMADTTGGEELTRFHWYDIAACAADATATYAPNPTLANGSFVKTNVNKFEFVEGADETDGHIAVWMYQYFQTDASNIATPDDAYDTEAATPGSQNDVDFKAALVTVDGAGVTTYNAAGRALYTRIDYTTSAEASCTYTVNEEDSNIVLFELDYTWNQCTTAACEAKPTVTPTDYLVFASGDASILDFEYAASADFAATAETDAPVYPFDGVPAAAEGDSVPVCLSFTYAHLYEGDATKGSYTGKFPTESGLNNQSWLNGNRKPDAEADDSPTATDFSMNAVMNKMCSDSSRVASVAAFTAASLAVSFLF